MIIAIDGPAASGKGTIARRLAAHYGLPHLDTGLLYRATAAAVIAEGRDLFDEQSAVAAARGLGLTDFDETALRSRQMAEAASIVAAMPGVRAALIDAQRAFAARPGGAVIDGRDIGTVVCPKATVKVFVIASASARAQRRVLELAQRGEKGDYNAVLADILRRDARDFGAGRSAATSGRRRRPTRHNPSRDRRSLRRSITHRRNGANQGVANATPPDISRRGALRQTAVGGPKPLYGAVDLLSLPFQMTDLVDDLLRLQLLLEIRRFVGALSPDQIVDLGEREAQFLAPKDHLHANAVCAAVVAGVTFPAGFDEAPILIESQRAKADAVQSRHLADRHFSRP